MKDYSIRLSAWFLRLENLARTNQVMIPQVWRSPEPDVCKTIQHSCLIRLTSVNNGILSLSKLPVPKFCTLPQARKNVRGVNKDIDKHCKIALIVPNSNVFWVSNLGVGQISSLGRGLSKDKFPPPWALVQEFVRAPGLSRQPFRLVQVVQEIKNKAKEAILGPRGSRCEKDFVIWRSSRSPSFEGKRFA